MGTRCPDRRFESGLVANCGINHHYLKSARPLRSGLCALSSLISKKGELISGAGKGSSLAQGHPGINELQGCQWRLCRLGKILTIPVSCGTPERIGMDGTINLSSLHPLGIQMCGEVGWAWAAPDVAPPPHYNSHNAPRSRPAAPGACAQLHMAPRWLTQRPGARAR